ncbi:hypothetical protein J31TS4_08700 [Paenibacillus sp. J31TS4]|nr:hypothetical protein J31TS4_08700 [Paenibacillus sp. J31TS4]
MDAAGCRNLLGGDGPAANPGKLIKDRTPPFVWRNGGVLSNFVEKEKKLAQILNYIAFAKKRKEKIFFDRRNF